MLRCCFLPSKLLLSEGGRWGWWCCCCRRAKDNSFIQMFCFSFKNLTSSMGSDNPVNNCDDNLSELSRSYQAGWTKFILISRCHRGFEFRCAKAPRWQRSRMVVPFWEAEQAWWWGSAVTSRFTLRTSPVCTPPQCAHLPRAHSSGRPLEVGTWACAFLGPL